MKNYIGILGGGQLAKMLSESATKYGYKTVILDPSEEACGKLSATKHLAKKYTDQESLDEMCKISKVITYEFENIPIETVEYIKRNGNIPQGERPLLISKHRVMEKSKIKELGIKTADFLKVTSKDELKKGVEELGYPLILKTCTEGYDGKGQWKIDKESDLENITLENREYILERKVDFQCEVSCMVIRSINGDIINFPVGENIHKNGILNMSIVPARVSDEIIKKVIENSKQIIEKLDFYGPLGIEYFIKGEEVYFNEMAPRPHNSIHYSMDACNYSQFDLHIKSLLGEKLEEPILEKKVVMLNILGEDKERLEKVIEDKDVKIYLYGKDQWKKARKMGHINYLGDNIEELIKKAKSF